MITTSLDRITDKIETFNKFGAVGNGKITRLSLSPEELEARDELCKRCRQLGMQISTDDMANIYATLKGNLFDSSMIIGSHLDTAKESEYNNGTIGALVALEVIETIVKQKIPHDHSITIAVFTNTEDARFYPKLMGTGVICGKLERSIMLDSTDCNGVTLKEALEASGYMGTSDNRVNSEKYIGYIELAIKQEDTDIGIIECASDKVNFCTEFIESIEKKIQEYGYRCMRLYSNEEYNAQFIADIIPAAIMAVPCGKNLENVEKWWKGANVLLQTILDIDKNN